MTSPRRLFVSVLLTGILATQAFMSIPPDRYEGWFWPFLNYPMYSDAHSEGEEISFRRLDGVPCGPGHPTTLTYDDLGVQWFKLDALLARALDDYDSVTGEARDRLRELIAEKNSGRICGARVYERSVRVGGVPEGGVSAVPWSLGLEVDIP